MAGTQPLSTVPTRCEALAMGPAAVEAWVTERQPYWEGPESEEAPVLTVVAERERYWRYLHAMVLAQLIEQGEHTERWHRTARVLVLANVALALALVGLIAIPLLVGR